MIRKTLVILTLGYFALVPAHAVSHALAPPGFHYETGGTTPVPDDPCWRLDLEEGGSLSPAALSAINATIGKLDGVTARVLTISDLASAQSTTLSSLSVRKYPGGAASVTCHATLHFANSSTESGVLSFADPGAYAPFQFQWLPDAKIANEVARIDRLRTSKNLLVVPDLKTPAIQNCVGRAFALGASEQYPGQLWAACAQKGGSNLIPPTRAAVMSSISDCADKMLASPEYAWAVPHPEARVPIGIALSGVTVPLAFPGSPGTLAQTQTSAIYQTEAVALATLYRQQGQANSADADYVKSAARIWCSRNVHAEAAQ